MGQVRELETEGALLSWGAERGEVTLLSARVQDGRVRIPDEIEGLPVTRLGKKAFLSSKLLREVALPGKLTEIGDWAFAYCSNLEKVWLPGRDFVLGRGIFKECEKLLSICRLGRGAFSGEQISEETLWEEQVGRLLGAVPVKLEADYLFNPKEAGSDEWLRRFDEKLKEFLARPDEDGFVKMVYCGEEDIVANVEYYLAERRRDKARLCFLRLINSIGLSEEFRGELSGYLLARTAGCASEAAWEVVFKEHGNERGYYEIFTQSGCFTHENCDEILTRMGDQFPEMKAYLMRYRAQHMGGSSFFDSLSLD